MMKATIYSGIAVLLMTVLGGCGRPHGPSERKMAKAPFAGPRPVAVLIQTDPGFMVVGSDMPLLAIYEDGEVIGLHRDQDNQRVYHHKRLSSSELAAVRDKIGSFGDYSRIRRFYDISPNITGQPETRIYLEVDGRSYVTSVYGLMLPETALPVPPPATQSEKADQLPKSLTDLYEYLTHVRFGGSTPWTPDYVEVMMWPYENPSGGVIHWPRGWPGLDSPYAMKRGDSYSIFLRGSELGKLRAFLRTRDEDAAVEIGGREWAVAYRFAFPSEPVWLEAFKPKGFPATAPAGGSSAAPVGPDKTTITQGVAA